MQSICLFAQMNTVQQQLQNYSTDLKTATAPIHCWMKGKGL